MAQIQTIKNGEIITAPGNFQECLAGLSFNYERALEQQDYFRRELEYIRDEKWKDKELKKLKAENECLQAQIDNGGFYITPDESKLIQHWIEHHDTHSLKGGVSGGTFSYIFTPTAIGTFGTIRCNICKQEYCFCDC